MKKFRSDIEVSGTINVEISPGPSEKSAFGKIS